MAVADEVDLLDPRRPVSHAGAGEQRVDRSSALVDRSVDGVLVGQVQVDGLGAGQLHVGEVHDHHFAPGFLSQLGGCGAHPGGASDDQDPFPVVAKCIEETHNSRPPGGSKWFRPRSSRQRSGP